MTGLSPRFFFENARFLSATTGPPPYEAPDVTVLLPPDDDGLCLGVHASGSSSIFEPCRAAPREAAVICPVPLDTFHRSEMS